MSNEEPDSDGVQLDRRRFIGTTTGVALFGTNAAGATVSSNPGDGGSGGGGGDGGGGGGGAPGGGDEHRTSVTLVTGETIHVTTRRDRRLGEESGDGDGDVVRTYAVDADETTDFHVLQEETGTYVIPDGADLDAFSRELFNVDLLVEQGLTDDGTDGTPVVVRLADAAGADGGVGVQSVGGFETTRTLASIDAVAGEVRKDRAAVSSRSLAASAAVERVYLDAGYEALLDESAGAIDAPAAREEFDVDGSGVSVAVLDTGVDADHPDFGDRVVHETDFSGDGTGDGAGHGTHVAGIVAGAGTESDGEYVGVAPGADLWNVKVLGDDGSGALSDIVAGIEHAVDQGADVINMSLGGPVQEDDPMADAVNYARDQGVVVAVASGNAYGLDSVNSPAHAEGAITVGAADGDGGIAGFSSGGPTPYDYRVKPDVVAPGVGVTSTGSDGAGEYPYADKDGTSMASPHVAGLAALLLEDDGDRSPEVIRSALVSTATPLDDAGVFLQGGGRVDADAALAPDLLVHDPVTSFGLYDEATTDAAEVTVENVGSAALDLDVSATLENVQSGEGLDDNVSVSPGSVSVDPGETATLEVTVDTADAFGYNSGVLALDAGDDSYRAVFGFVRGLAVTVEKLPHEDSGGVEGDGLWLFSDDGAVSESVSEAFGADGTFTTTVFGDAGSLNVWSWGALDDRPGSPRAMVVEEGVDAGDGAHVTLDEGEVVPRVLDTSAVADDAPFVSELYYADLYATLDDLTISYGFLGVGGDGVPTTYFSPVAEADLTNPYTEYLFQSAATASGGLDADSVYHLLYPTRSVDAPEDVLAVDPDHLATEAVTYHRSAGESYSVSPFAYPVDDGTFPKFPITYAQGIGDDRVEQTWHRTPVEAEYAESWRGAGPQIDRSTNWEPNRTGLVPGVGERIDSEMDRDPLLGFIAWDVEDDHLTLSGQWHTDQSPHQFVETYFSAPFGEWNEAAVRFDGETVASGLLPTFGFDFDAPVEPGTEVEVEMHGNVVESLRGTRTVSTYRATYEPGEPSRPPEIDRLAVAGLGASNDVPAGRVVAFVDVETPADGVDEVAAFYAPAGTTGETPFDDPAGWTAAEVVYDGNDRVGVLLDVAGEAATYDLAVAATDAAGHRVEATSFGAVEVADGADVAASVDVRPEAINPGSGQRVPVLIEATDSLDPAEVVVDSLRFGEPGAVHAGDGAQPVGHQRLGHGALQVQFAAADAGYDCDADPAAAQLVGELADGSRLSGVDLVDIVGCSR